MILVPALCALIATIILYVFIVQVSAQVHINTALGILVMLAVLIVPMIGGMFVAQTVAAIGILFTALSIFVGMVIGFCISFFWAMLTYHPV